MIRKITWNRYCITATHAENFLGVANKKTDPYAVGIAITAYEDALCLELIAVGVPFVEARQDAIERRVELVALLRKIGIDIDDEGEYGVLTREQVDLLPAWSDEE